MCRGNYEYQCHFFSIANLTCSWTLAWAGRCRLFCVIGLAFRTKNCCYFCFVFKYLRTFIRVWLSDDDDPDDGVSFCHDAGHVRRRVIVTETKEWAKDIPVNDKCPHNGPLRLNSTMPALHQDTLARTRGQRNPLSSHWPQGPRGGFWLANLLPRPAPMFTLTRSLNSKPGSDHHKHFPSGSKSCLDALADCDCPFKIFGDKQIFKFFYPC